MNQFKRSLCSVTYAYVLRLMQSLTLLEVSYAKYPEHGITCTLNILNIHYNNSDLYQFCKQTQQPLQQTCKNKNDCTKTQHIHTHCSL
jgi:hypothetical protein